MCSPRALYPMITISKAKMKTIAKQQHKMKKPEKADSFLKSGMSRRGDMSVIMTKL